MAENNISKELLQKYELGQCTDQELAVVQAWLDNDDWNTLEAPRHEFDHVEPEIWSALVKELDAETPIKDISGGHSKQRSWSSPWAWFTQKGAAAACIALTLAAALALFYYQRNRETANFQAHNTQPTLQWFNKASFDLALGGNSSARLDFQTGTLALRGDIMLKPKRKLTFYDAKTKTSLHFNEGEVYYVSEDPQNNRLIILRKREINFLPPPIQQQIRKQFHLT
ncbi:hypothetical protein ACL9RF_06250 [Sphingobacterium sp. Mn56C]|uniref:hypothetical protein n=1 Tax=Sphingobacterium sp. Mn56C TaxID=3395261 RepID=UPI003BD3BF33